jgi:hypothetical protein
MQASGNRDLQQLIAQKNYNQLKPEETISERSLKNLSGTKGSVYSPEPKEDTGTQILQPLKELSQNMMAEINESICVDTNND